LALGQELYKNIGNCIKHYNIKQAQSLVWPSRGFMYTLTKERQDNEYFIANNPL